MGFLSGLCSIFLHIYNIILMMASIILMIKGLYLLAYGQRIKQELGFFSVVVPIDNVYKNIGMSYVVPAGMMMIIAYVGIKAAGSSVTSLVIYVALIVLQMSASSYGISQLSSEINSKNNVFSVFSYFNKLLISDELGRLQAVAYPEIGIQISLLMSSLYLLYKKFNEKRQLKQYQKNTRRLQVLQALLEEEKSTQALIRERLRERQAAQAQV